MLKTDSRTESKPISEWKPLTQLLYMKSTQLLEDTKMICNGK